MRMPSWLQYAAVSNQGGRETMEDYHSINEFHWKREDLRNSENGKSSFGSAFLFAVFDGHGGTGAAEFCQKTICQMLFDDPGFTSQEFIEQAVKNTFLKTDLRYCSIAKQKQMNDGTTANVVILFSEDEFEESNRKSRDFQKQHTSKVKLLVANAGDSRAILGTLTDNPEIQQLSLDHKPTVQAEKQRIERFGSSVVLGAIDGVLSVSRSIGDPDFKQNIPLQQNQVISVPDIMEHSIEASPKVIVLASDGLWDVMSNFHVMRFLKRAIVEEKHSLQTAAEELVEHALLSSADNITVIVIGLFLDQIT